MNRLSKYPLLRCPICKLELRPTMHGWAFASGPNTECKGPEVKSVYAHPFQVVQPPEVTK